MTYICAMLTDRKIENLVKNDLRNWFPLLERALFKAASQPQEREKRFREISSVGGENFKDADYIEIFLRVFTFHTTREFRAIAQSKPRVSEPWLSCRCSGRPLRGNRGKAIGNFCDLRQHLVVLCTCCTCKHFFARALSADFSFGMADA